MIARVVPTMVMALRGMGRRERNGGMPKPRSRALIQERNDLLGGMEMGSLKEAGTCGASKTRVSVIVDAQ